MKLRRQASRILVWLGLVSMGGFTAVVFAGCTLQQALPPPVLIVETAPEDGVEVRVNTEVVGVSPVQVEGLHHGRAVIEIDDPRYKKAVRRVDIPETGDLTVRMELVPRVGFVSFESQPPLAEVRLADGRVLGKTPLANVPVPVGEQGYSLRLENYIDEPGTIEIEEDYIYTRVHQMRPKPARLTVTAAPVRTSIWINDQLQTQRTPAEFELTPGAYRVLVHTKGYLSNDDIVELGPNEERRVEFTMVEGDAPPGMVLVPEGEFILGTNGGSPDESPQQKVFLKAYYIDRYQVTNRQWKAVFPDYEYEQGKGNFPVTGINFRQADQYAKAVGKRLPSELEWEKAARGTEGLEYPWGNTWDPARCNSAEQRDRGLRPVGSFKTGVSPFGCFDMAGNVYEWTSSWYQPYPGNDVITKDYGQVYRVLRGGSFRTGSFEARCARRYFDNMDRARNDYGLRLAADIGQEDKVITFPIRDDGGDVDPTLTPEP